MDGYINLVGLFQAEAASLFHAVQRGGLIHKTKNIKDSGALLETRFREIINRRLPPEATLAHGYLFDLDSKCTPQIDAMLLSANDNYSMMDGEGGAVYAPFTCCKAYVEVKSSIGNAAKQLKQTVRIANRIDEMRKSLQAHNPASFQFEQVASVLLFVKSDGAKPTDFITWYAKSRHRPTLIVFLDKARVIAQRPFMRRFFETNVQETLTVEESLSNGDPWLFQPACNTESEARGRVLLWLYYFLLHRATVRKIERPVESSENATGRVKVEIPPVEAFIRAANRQFPLIPIQELKGVTAF